LILKHYASHQWIPLEPATYRKSPTNKGQRFVIYVWSKQRDFALLWSCIPVEN
jgi:hypothetical protein